MVFQNYALYPHLSVAENIAFGLRLRKTPKSVIDERVALGRALLDLTPYLDRRPKELSGGQRQRVAMGRAIVRQPQVFLMDEPLSNLDAKLRVQMRADISKLQRDLGTTTIYVTHDQVEAMTMGDRVAVMSQGVLQQVDAPQRLYDEPANLFVAGFIGTPPMNLLEADVAVDERRRRRCRSAGSGSRCRTRRSRATRACAATTAGASSLGIRADDLHLARRPSRPARRSTRRLELVEALGSQSIAYFQIDAHGDAAAPRASTRRLDEETGRRGRDRDAAEPRRLARRARGASPAARRRRSRSRSTSPALHLFDQETRCAAAVAALAARRGRLRCVARCSRRRGDRRSASRGRRAPPTGAALRRSRSRPCARRSPPQRIYFVMTDRYANGDPRTTAAAAPGRAASPASTRPTPAGSTAATSAASPAAAPTADAGSRGSRRSASPPSG